MGNTFFRVEYILYKYIATFNESICGVNRIGDQTWGYLLRGSKTGGWIGVIIAAITSKMKRPNLPTHIMLDSSSCDIAKDSVILLEQLRTIDKQRLKEKVCHVDADVLRRVDEALKISLELA